MALTIPQQKFIGDTIRTVQKLMDLYGDLVELDVLWAGAPNYDGTIDQEGIDSVSSFAGMTLTNLADAEFALASIKTTMTGALAALAVLDNMPG